MNPDLNKLAAEAEQEIEWIVRNTESDQDVHDEVRKCILSCLTKATEAQHQHQFDGDGSPCTICGKTLVQIPSRAAPASAEQQDGDDRAGLYRIISTATSQLPDYGISITERVIRTAVIDAYELSKKPGRPTTERKDRS